MPKETKQEQGLPVSKLFERIGQKDVELQIAQEQIAFLAQKLNEADARIKELGPKKKKIKE